MTRAPDPDVSGVADRAASVVRDQVRALLGQAAARAAELEQQAAQEAEGVRLRARHSAAEVLSAIEAIEADLEAHIEQLRHHIDATDQTPQVPDELMAASATVATQAAQLRHVLGPRDADTDTDIAAESPAVPPQEAEGPATLADQARRRVQTEDDEGLIQMFAMVRKHKEEPDQTEYWSTLGQAVLDEVARRPRFAEEADVGAGLKRAERKERREALAALRDAGRALDEA